MINWNKYNAPKAPFGLTQLVDRNEDVLNFVFKFYPELDTDWNDKDTEFVLTWRYPVRYLYKIGLGEAVHRIGVQDYQKICTLPRRQFAESLLSSGSLLLSAYYNLDLLEEWAGGKRKLVTDGNLIRFVSHNPMPPSHQKLAAERLAIALAEGK